MGLFDFFKKKTNSINKEVDLNGPKQIKNDEKSENDKNHYDLFYMGILGDYGGKLTIDLLEMPKPTNKDFITDEAEKTMKDGEENGLVKTYHETGEIKVIGNTKAGTPHGLSTYYNKNGQIYALVKFENGRIIGQSLHRIPDYESDEYEKNNEGSLNYINYTLDKNGELQMEMVCVNDKLVETRMYEKGITSVRIGSFGEEHYENGKLVKNSKN